MNGKDASCWNHKLEIHLHGQDFSSTRGASEPSYWIPGRQAGRQSPVRESFLFHFSDWLRFNCLTIEDIYFSVFFALSCIATHASWKKFQHPQSTEWRTHITHVVLISCRATHDSCILMPVFLYIPGTSLCFPTHRWGVVSGIATLAGCVFDVVMEIPLQEVVIISLLHTLAILDQTFPSEHRVLDLGEILGKHSLSPACRWGDWVKCI